MTWTSIPTSDYDQDSPLTQPLMGAIIGNISAVPNGDPGAPRVQAIAAMSHQGVPGAVGMPVFARRTSGAADVAFGSTLSGASLSPTSAAAGVSVNGGGAPSLNVGAALNGTYVCCGTYDHTVLGGDGNGGTVTLAGATVWMRLS